MGLRRRAVAALLAAGFLAGLAGPALATRADGVCGGIGHWDPVMQACVE
jgi:hypothetical protein